MSTNPVSPQPSIDPQVGRRFTKFGAPIANPGERFGGRQVGTVNKRTEAVAMTFTRLRCNPLALMLTIALNKLPCGVCRGKGKTRYKLAEERPCLECEGGEPNGAATRQCWACSGTQRQRLAERTCESCYGSLMETCNPELRGKMASDACKYYAPQLRSVEVSGTIGHVPIDLTRLSDDELAALKKLSERVALPEPEPVGDAIDAESQVIDSSLDSAIHQDQEGSGDAL
jgi:hypothetical protein